MLRSYRTETEIYYDLGIQAHRQNKIYTNIVRMQQYLKTYSLIK